VGSKQQALPYDRDEAVLELYQAQNAIQIARAVGADRLAADSLSKAEALLAEAQDLQGRRQDTHMIVSRAREAAQMAEDARVLALKRGDEDRLSRERERQLEEGQARARAEADAQQAQAAAAREAEEARRASAERAAAQAERDQAITVQAAVQSSPAPIEAQPVPTVAPQPTGAQRQARAELLERLNSVLLTRDTPRGLVVTLPDSSFETISLRRSASERLALLATMLSSRRDLTVYVEGFTDERGNDGEQREISQRRAQEVRATLVGNGLAAVSIQAVGFGGTRPIVSNATAGGREQNRRVEIVISGPSIGGMALWDRTYPLTSRH
jgi:outer membrane protein OmpA-like peptidoglycan-associated protein